MPAHARVEKVSFSLGRDDEIDRTAQPAYRTRPPRSWPADNPFP